LGWVSFLNPTYGSKKKIDPPLGGRQRAKEQKNKGLKSWGDTRNPKTDAVVVVAGAVPDAVGRTTVIRVEVPRTAAQTLSRLRTIIILDKPRRSIRRRSDIVIVPIVFAPLPNIATHVIESPSIGPFLTHRMSFILRISVIS
jgi:hypothetical protein